MDRSDFPNIRVERRHEDAMAPLAAFMAQHPQLRERLQTGCAEQLRQLTRLLQKKNDHPESITPKDTADVALLIEEMMGTVRSFSAELS